MYRGRPRKLILKILRQIIIKITGRGAVGHADRVGRHRLRVAAALWFWSAAAKFPADDVGGNQSAAATAALAPSTTPAAVLDQTEI
jgi:hypothetical protein